jgi:hypothetical protein
VCVIFGFVKAVLIEILFDCVHVSHQPGFDHSRLNIQVNYYFVVSSNVLQFKILNLIRLTGDLHILLKKY